MNASPITVHAYGHPGSWSFDCGRLPDGPFATAWQEITWPSGAIVPALFGAPQDRPVNDNPFPTE